MFLQEEEEESDNEEEDPSVNFKKTESTNDAAKFKVTEKKVKNKKLFTF